MYRLLAFALALPLIGAAPLNPLPPRAPAGFENVCGWLANPTPGNWWITDRTREWTISVQGGFAAPGWDTVDYDPSAHQYVRTNGNYGYGCACAQLRVDHRAGTVLAIRGITARPLAACRADRALRHP